MVRTASAVGPAPAGSTVPPSTRAAAVPISRSGGPEPFAYEPALDGVRALAVLAVMGYHAGLSWLPGGFLGVDVFFVLSGFLITLLLLGERAGNGTISLRRFFARRARRLLPALAVVVLAVVVYDQIQEGGTARVRSDALASLLYVQNWHLIGADQSYFAQFDAPSPLQHLWSLAIEEQWYLVWPIAVMALLRWSRSRGVLVAVVSMLAAGSAIAMAVLSAGPGDPSRAYYGTDARLQALLVGALAALWWFGRSSTPRRTMALAGCLGFGVLVLLVVGTSGSSAALYTGGFTVAALAAVLLVTATLVGGPARAALRTPPLPAIGRISYGLYLWHWPVFVWLTPDRAGIAGASLVILRFGVTFLLAFASYRGVELPIRDRRCSSASASLRIAVGAVAVGLLATAAPLPGAPSRSAAVEGSGVADSKPDREHGAATAGTRVLLAGDSVAFTLGFFGLPPRYRSSIHVRGEAILGCGLARGPVVVRDVVQPQNERCAAWPVAYASAVAADRPDVVVLLVGAWEVYDRIVGERTLRFDTPAMSSYLDDELTTALDTLTARGARLVLLTAPCFDPPTLQLDPGPPDERGDPERVRWVNDRLRRFARQHRDDVSILDLHGFLCARGELRPRFDAASVQSDGVHFTRAGAREVWTWLAPRITRIARGHHEP